MKSKLIHEHTRREDVRAHLRDRRRGDGSLAIRQGEPASGASRRPPIGAFSAVTLGYFDWDAKEYRKIPVQEQVEVLSLIGDIALKDGGRRCTPMSSSAVPTARRGEDTSSRPVSGRHSK